MDQYNEDLESRIANEKNAEMRNVLEATRDAFMIATDAGVKELTQF